MTPHRVIILAESFRMGEDFFKASLVGLVERLPIFVRFDDLSPLYGMRDATIFILAPVYTLNEEAIIRTSNNRRIFVSDWR